MDLGLTDKKALVTGSTAGIGLAAARGLAHEGGGVTVNSVLPGPTTSEGVGRMVEQSAAEQGLTISEVERQFFKTMRPSSVIQRFATVDESAAMIVYICSALASATTGAALRVDGGVVRAIV